MALTHSPRVVTSGLIGYWDSANIKSYPGAGTTWTDLTKNGNNGTLTGGISLDEKNALSYSLNTDQITFPDVSLFDFGANQFTVGGIAYIAGGYSSYNGQVVNKWNNGGAPGTNEWILGFGVGSTGRQPGFTIEGGSTSYVAREEVNVSVPGWYYIIGVREANNIKLYLNGELKATTDVTGVVINTVGARTLTVGRFDGIATSGFNGDIGIIHAYDKALTAVEVSQNFEALRGRFGI